MVHVQAGHSSLGWLLWQSGARQSTGRKMFCRSVSLSGLPPSNCQWIAVESGGNCSQKRSGRKWSCFETYPWLGAQKSYLLQSAAFGILVAFRYPLGLWDPIFPAPNERGTIPNEYQSQKHASNYATILIISIYRRMS